VSGLPVVDPDGHRVMGWVTHRDVLRAYNDRLERSVVHAMQREPSRSPAQGGQRGHTPLDRLQGCRIIDVEIGLDQPPAGLRVSDLR